jgi:hypothetical protein
MRKVILAFLIIMPTLALADEVIVDEPVDTGAISIDDGSSGAVDYVLVDNGGSDDNGTIDDNHIIDDTGAKVFIKIDPRESSGFGIEPRCGCVGIDRVAFGLLEHPEEPLGTVALAKDANKKMHLASADLKDKSHKDHTGNKKK